MDEKWINQSDKRTMIKKDIKEKNYWEGNKDMIDKLLLMLFINTLETTAAEDIFRD